MNFLKSTQWLPYTPTNPYGVFWTVLSHQWVNTVSGVDCQQARCCCWKHISNTSCTAACYSMETRQQINFDPFITVIQSTRRNCCIEHLFSLWRARMTPWRLDTQDAKFFVKWGKETGAEWSAVTIQGTCLLLSSRMKYTLFQIWVQQPLGASEAQCPLGIFVLASVHTQTSD